MLTALGRLLLAMGNITAAVGVYSERTAVLPNSADAYLELANVQMEAKDPVAASVSLNTALRLKPGDPRARAALVAVELARGRFDRALEIAKAVQGDLPRAPLGYVLEGDVLVATKKFTQAVELYKKGFALRKSGLLAIKIYDAWAMGGKPDQADAWIKQWLAEHPDDVLSRRHVAYGLMQSGNYALALEQYKIVLKTQPKDPVVLNNMAWGLHKMGDPTALAYAQRAYETIPGDAGIADTLAQILLDKGELVRAVELLQKAVAANPANWEVRFHYAQALAKTGDKGAAIRELQVIVGAGSKVPQQAEAITLLKQLK